jgi:hypothetical protein
MRAKDLVDDDAHAAAASRHPMPLTGNVMTAIGIKLERHDRPRDSHGKYLRYNP